jgi:RNA polymerase sigma factor (sigma-70 family)
LTSEETAIAHERHVDLALAVRGLPRRQREVIVCRYYLELSVTETANLLELSEGSVKQHAHRALRSLGVAMGGVP